MALAGCAAFSGTATAHKSPHGADEFRVYGLPDWRGEVAENRLEFQTYRSAVLSDRELTYEQKTDLITRRAKQIGDAFRTKRTNVFINFKHAQDKSNSCTKGYSGGTKVCERKCEAAVYPHTHVPENAVKGAWISTSRDDLGPWVLERGKAYGKKKLLKNDGRSICAPELRRSGQGRVVAYTKGTFRIERNWVDKFVDLEADAFLTAVTN